MQLYNIKHPEEKVIFSQAVLQGLGKDQGLFFPEQITAFSEEQIEQLLKLDFVERSSKILQYLIQDPLISEQNIADFVKQAFNFPVKLHQVNPQVHSLELFHGPTLAFKDFGGRFMAQVVNHLAQQQRITILTATSGDTGAAVAHAFYRMNNVKVVILYPQGRISSLQEKLFCTLGDNITTVAIDGDFDACQAIVKQAFDDQQLVDHLKLNSANSINISRLVAQVCYYFEAYAQVKSQLEQQQQQLAVSVPSGNFGNLTAGLIAKALGLPIKRFIATTNVNDTVPRYLATGQWSPNETIATLSNAMDVSRPNNWARIEQLFQQQGWQLDDLDKQTIDDQTTQQTIAHLLKEYNYLSEPHSAVGYQGLVNSLQANELGIFLATAHPAKFKSIVEQVVGFDIGLPAELAKHADLELKSLYLDNNYQQVKDLLTNLY